MKPITYLLFTLCSSVSCYGQVIISSTGSDLTIIAGTAFTIEKLCLTPSADFTISNNSITKATSVVHTTANNYITRVYKFTNNSQPFSGSIQFGYTDGAELNNIPENALVINNHNGSSWNSFTSPSRDNSANVILNTGLTNVTLNELTLSSEFSTLPLQWLSFTAAAHNNQVFLQWSVTIDSGIAEFGIEHSTDGQIWHNTGSMPAMGNNQNGKYSFIHTRPSLGVNHYRIVIIENGRSSVYSQSKKVLFRSALPEFEVENTLITTTQLRFRAQKPTVLSLYHADGRKLAQYSANAGWVNADMSQYGKGVYYIRSSTLMIPILLQ